MKSKFLFSVLIIFFANISIYAKISSNNFKSIVIKEANQYGLKLDEWKESNTLFVSFDNDSQSNIKTEYPVSLGLKSIPSTSIDNCPNLLNAGPLQEFGDKKRIANESGLEIYSITPPKDSKINSVLFTFKKGQCLGLFGTMGRNKSDDNNIRLQFFKRIIREF